MMHNDHQMEVTAFDGLSVINRWLRIVWGGGRGSDVKDEWRAANQTLATTTTTTGGLT